MRVAVTYEDGMIFQHFGHTQQFKVYDIEDGKVVGSQVVGTNGQGHGALAHRRRLRRRESDFTEASPAVRTRQFRRYFRGLWAMTQMYTVTIMSMKRDIPAANTAAGTNVTDIFCANCKIIS